MSLPQDQYKSSPDNLAQQLEDVAGQVGNNVVQLFGDNDRIKAFSTPSPPIVRAPVVFPMIPSPMTPKFIAVKPKHLSSSFSSFSSSFSSTTSSSVDSYHPQIESPKQYHFEERPALHSSTFPTSSSHARTKEEFEFHEYCATKKKESIPFAEMMRHQDFQQMRYATVKSLHGAPMLPPPCLSIAEKYMWDVGWPLLESDAYYHSSKHSIQSSRKKVPTTSGSVDTPMSSTRSLELRISKAKRLRDLFSSSDPIVLQGESILSQTSQGDGIELGNVRMSKLWQYIRNQPTSTSLPPQKLQQQPSQLRVTLN